MLGLQEFMIEGNPTERVPATEREFRKFSFMAENFASSQFDTMMVFSEDNSRTEPIPYIDDAGNEELLVFQRIRTLVVNGNKTQSVNEYKLLQLDGEGNEIPSATYINAVIHERKESMASLIGPIESFTNSEGLPATSEEVELTLGKIDRIHKRKAYKYSK